MSDGQQKSKADVAEERRQNLPLPEDPPAASDFNSADARTVNVGAGRDVDTNVSYGRGGEAGLEGAATNTTTGGVDSGVGRAGYGTAQDAAK